MEFEFVVKFKGDELKGVLIKEDDNFITLKLSSGYNANLKKSEIEVISKKKIGENRGIGENWRMGEGEKKGLPRITILHTGGTIASKVDYKTGAVSSKFTADELMGLFPELNDVAQIDAKMIGNLFSEDMRFSHYNLMLSEIEKAVSAGSVGVIVSHGTDTMHYASAALQYSLKNLPVPVILVGAQRSSDRASSDAFSNLGASVDFIIDNYKKDLAFRRVGICMHEAIDDSSFVILDGINAKKMHSSRRDAFKQINYLPFARVEKGKVEVLRKDLLSSKSSQSLSFVKYGENLKIGFFKAHPNLYPEEISALSFYDAVIIEGTGLGHMAINEVDSSTKIHLKNLSALKDLSKKTKVVMGVQTVYGEVNMNVYSTGRYLLEAGVLGNLMNLTTESLFARVAYCLSQKDKSFEECWKENLEGFEMRSIEIEIKE